jgi:dynein light chain roadblock-type
LEETLGRLNKKAGVKATIVLDRTSGAILKTSGQILSVRVPKTDGSSVPGLTEGQTESQAVEELAAMVWNFVNAAGGLVQDLDSEVGHSETTDDLPWLWMGLTF